VSAQDGSKRPLTAVVEGPGTSLDLISASGTKRTKPIAAGMSASIVDYRDPSAVVSVGPKPAMFRGEDLSA
jgi:hypothetical protein